MLTQRHRIRDNIPEGKEIIPFIGVEFERGCKPNKAGVVTEGGAKEQGCEWDGGHFDGEVGGDKAV